MVAYFTATRLRAFLTIKTAPGIRDAGERDAATPEIMFRNLDSSQKTLEGWGNLLGLARARYIVAASAACLEPTTSAPAVETPPAAPVDTVSAPADLAATILDGWATWGATLDKMGDDYSDEEADAAVAPMNRVVRAAAELPATAENIAAKALAHAWRDWVSTERPGQPRDAYDLDGRLVYDLHAAIMARGNVSEAKRPDLLAAADIDLASADMTELHAIRDAVNLLVDVSGAMLWQGRHRRADHPSGAYQHNAAGLLLEWLNNALCDVLSKAESEARRRQPRTIRDRETRLIMLAESTISNGDPVQTAAFARELLATVEA